MLSSCSIGFECRIHYRSLHYILSPQNISAASQGARGGCCFSSRGAGKGSWKSHGRFIFLHNDTLSSGRPRPPLQLGNRGRKGIKVQVQALPCPQLWLELPLRMAPCHTTRSANGLEQISGFCVQWDVCTDLQNHIHAAAASYSSALSESFPHKISSKPFLSVIALS